MARKLALKVKPGNVEKAKQVGEMLTEKGQAASNDDLPPQQLPFASPEEATGMEARIPSLQLLCYKPLAECILLQSNAQDVADIVESLGNFDDCVRTLRHMRRLVDPLNQATVGAWSVALRGFARCFPAKMLCLETGHVIQLYRLGMWFSDLTHLELHDPCLITLSWLKGLNHLCCLGLHGCKKLAGSQLKYINGLRNLKALSFSECYKLPEGLDYEGLLGLPPLVSLSIAHAPTIDDKFMQYVLKYNTPDRCLTPGGSSAENEDKDLHPLKKRRMNCRPKGSPAKPTLKILILASTNITQVTVDMLKTCMATPVYVDLQWSFKVPEASVEALAAWWKLKSVRPRVLARSAAVVAGVEEPKFRTQVSYLRGCVCGLQDVNNGRQKLQRWLAAELLALPYPLAPPDRASLADTVGTDRDRVPHLQITLHDPLTDPPGAASETTGDRFAAYLDGDVPYNLDLPWRLDPGRSPGAPSQAAPSNSKILRVIMKPIKVHGRLCARKPKEAHPLARLARKE